MAHARHVTRILTVTYGAGHANMVVPVVREMAVRGWDTQTLALTAASQRFAVEGLPHLGFRDLLEAGDEGALALGERILADSHNPASGIPEEESRAYLGLSMRDLIDEIGEREAWERYAAFQRHAFLPVRTLRRAIARIRPDAVLATSSPRAERAALIAASEAGIPSIAIDDGFGLRPWFFPAFVPDLDPDVICVPSTIAVENYARRQPPPRGAVVLTGNPSFDRLASVPEPEAARARLGLPAGRPLVTINTQPYFDMERIEAMFLAATQRLPDLMVGVRLHPSLRIRPGRHAIPWMVELSDAPLDDVLAASAVIATVSSTTGQEAVLAGRPLIQFGPGLEITDPAQENANELPLFQYGASLLVDRPEDLTDTIARALSPETRAALRTRVEQLLPAPGDAAARVTDAVQRAIERARA